MKLRKALLHVCMVSTSFATILPETQGAINNYIFELAKSLSQWDEVSLFGRGVGKYDAGTLHVRSFSYSLPSAFSKYTQIRDFAYSSLYSRHLVANIQKINKNRPIELLHINNVYETPVAKFIKNILGIHTVCSVHNFFKAPLLISSCDKILANSYFMKNFLVNNAHFEEKKIDVLPIAVDINKFKPVPNAKDKLGLQGREVILFIGRKVPYKGPQVLIDALPKICKVYPKTLAIFIGPDYFFGSNSGSYSAFLKEKARKLNVDKNVSFRNFVPEPDLLTYLNAAVMLVCPSIWQEPFGKVAIEANACEKPVVSSRAGGLAELIEDGKNGLLVPPNNSNALASAIIRLFEDKENVAKMGEYGRSMVQKKYTYSIAAEKCRQIYKSLYQ